MWCLTACAHAAENYFTTPRSEARKILGLYKDYLQQTRKVGEIFNDAKELLGQEPVELSTVCLLVSACSPAPIYVCGGP
jgi:hypothetical protein